LQNHENHPTGSTPLPEVNATLSHFGGGRGRGRGRGRGHGSGRNQNFLGPRHWYRACRTAKHWVDLYQASQKEKDKRIETNFIGHCDPLETTQSDFVSMCITHLDIADFMTDPNEKMN
ncbi:LOW QUALITY PROTEIN: hypothetical protein CFOL_v3_29853, partial [Cephalotus follicularis]